MIRAAGFFVSGLIAAFTVFGLCGCGSSEQVPLSVSEGSQFATEALSGISGTADVFGPQDSDVDQQPTESAHSAEERRTRVIYRSEIILAAESFVGLEDRVEALTTRSGGFVEKSRITGSTGEQRRGEWVLRIPVSAYREVVGELRRFGEFRSCSETAEEVTSEWADLEARIRSMAREETTLLRLMEDRTAGLDDVLKVEKELSRIRCEIERLEARRRLLGDLTQYSTVTLIATEIGRFVPPETPTFGTEVTRVWQAGLYGLSAAIRWVVLVLVAVSPWAAFLAASVLFGRPVLSRIRARTSRAGHSA